MFCGNCGQRLEENVRFCPQCGTPVPQVQTYTPPTTPPPQNNGLYNVSQKPKNTKKNLGFLFFIPLLVVGLILAVLLFATGRGSDSDGEYKNSNEIAASKNENNYENIPTKETEETEKSVETNDSITSEESLTTPETAENTASQTEKITTPATEAQTTSLPATTKKPSATQPEPAKAKPMTNYIGKTVADVKNAYGSNYIFSALSGSSIMHYQKEKMVFILDQYYTTPGNGARINSVFSYGNSVIIGSLYGAMTYNEIVSAAGTYVGNKKPEKYFNAMGEYWEYSLEFTYGEYIVTYIWEKDPNTSKSTEGIARKKASNQASPSATTAPPVTTPPPATSAPSQNYNQKKLVDEITKYLEDAFFYYKGVSVIGVEVYSDTASTLSLTYTTDDPSHLFGVDYHKNTRQVMVYDFGVLKFSDTLPG